MQKRIFIWVAHPRAGTFCKSIADAYQRAAQEAEAEVRRMDLADMQFDPAFEGYGESEKSLEPDLVEWQQNLAWSNHVFFVHPYWWGAMPSSAKAVLDRALTPGFAFRYHSRDLAWDKLLEGRTGDAVITADTPTLVDTILYRSPARRVLKNQVLKFCGIKPRRIVQFGSIKKAQPERMKNWLKRSARMGAQAALAVR